MKLSCNFLVCTTLFMAAPLLNTQSQAAEIPIQKHVPILGMSFTAETGERTRSFPQKSTKSREAFQVSDNSIQMVSTTKFTTTDYPNIGELFRLDICFDGKEKTWLTIFDLPKTEPSDQRLTLVINEIALMDSGIHVRGGTITHHFSFSMTYLCDASSDSETKPYVTKLMSDLYVTLESKFAVRQIANGQCDLSIGRSFNHKAPTTQQKIKLSAGTAGPTADPALKNFLINELPGALGLGDKFKEILSQRLIQASK